MQEIEQVSEVQRYYYKRLKNILRMEERREVEEGWQKKPVPQVPRGWDPIIQLWALWSSTVSDAMQELKRCSFKCKLMGSNSKISRLIWMAEHSSSPQARLPVRLQKPLPCRRKIKPCDQVEPTQSSPLTSLCFRSHIPWADFFTSLDYYK